MSDTRVIHPDDIVNRRECQALIDDLNKAVESGARVVVVDCSECKYLNSRAMGEIIAAHITLAARGGCLRLVKPQGFVLKCLESVGVLTLLECYDSVEDAEGSLE